jgi:hypothetical protein
MGRRSSEASDGPIAELNIDIWGASMGLTQDDRDPDDIHETVAEFKQWADDQGYMLRPAFEWRSAVPKDGPEGQHGRIITPLVTLAVYTEEGLQAVYPYSHGDGEEVRPIHDGIETLESMPETGDVDTVSCNYVQILAPPVWRESRTTYSRQYEQSADEENYRRSLGSIAR